MVATQDLSASSERPGPGSRPRREATAATDLIQTAVALGVCLVGSYNRRQVTLAPIGTFVRNGRPFLRACTLKQDGAPPNSHRVGTFDLAGLHDVALANTRFTRRDMSPRRSR